MCAFMLNVYILLPNIAAQLTYFLSNTTKGKEGYLLGANESTYINTYGMGVEQVNTRLCWLVLAELTTVCCRGCTNHHLLLHMSPLTGIWFDRTGVQ